MFRVPMLSAILFLTLSAVKCDFIVPEATLEFLSPKGLKISIPDTDPAVTLVAFHVNLNEEFDGLTHGHWARDIIKKREGRWTYIIQDLKVKQGDTVYYWIYVIKGLGYHALDKSYKVTQANPHGIKDNRPPPQPPPPPPQTYPLITPSHHNNATTTNTVGSSIPNRGESPQRCPQGLSNTYFNGGRQACRDQVILDERFDNLDRWSHEVQIGGSQLEDEFTVFIKDTATSSVTNGNLLIRPMLLEERYDEDFVRSGKLAMDGCTSVVPEQCVRTAVSYLILPPTVAARLTTKNRFSFRYGIVEIVAQLPKGDWIVPELWLEPVKQSSQSHRRMILARSRGNSDSSNQLEAGLQIGTFSQLGQRTSDPPWSDDYHKIKLTWTPDKLEFSIDGDSITRMESREEVRNEEFYLTLGIHVAGSKDFSDNMSNKPWRNSDPKRFVTFWEAKKTWHPTWTENSVLKVKSVTVTAI